MSLVAASASALEPRLRSEPLTERLTIEPIRKLFGGLWAFLSSIWDKNGGSLDPDGSPISQPSGPGATADNGGSLDPSG
jgi:hypothetical protein